MDNSARIDLFSSLKPGWIQTNKRGRPGNKRKLETVLIGNPNCCGGKQKMEVSDAISSTDDPPAYLIKGKATDDSGGSRRNQVPVRLCCCCRKDINSCEALGGHVVFNEERNFWRLVPPLPEQKRKKRERERERVREAAAQLQGECPWCKKSFVNRYAVAAHSRFCPDKIALMSVNVDWMTPAAPAPNFVLNRTSAEPSVLPNAIGLSWQREFP